MSIPKTFEEWIETIKPNQSYTWKNWLWEEDLVWAKEFWIAGRRAAIEECAELCDLINDDGSSIEGGYCAMQIREKVKP
jgi:hypothetical protein